MLSTNNDDRQDARNEAETTHAQRLSNIQAANAACPSDTSPELFHTPRLGIFHLLAWIAVSAVLITIVTWNVSLNSMPDRFPVWIEVIYIATSCTCMTVLAAGVVGTCVLVRDRSRGRGGPLQAGHWILINTTAASISSLLATMMIISLTRTPLHSIVFAILAAQQFFTTALWLVAAIRAREPFAWRSMFGFLAISSATAGFLHFYSAFFPLPYFMSGFISQFPIGKSLTLVILSIVVFIDIFRRTKRDWLHWLGVAILFIISIVTAVQCIVSLVFLR